MPKADAPIPLAELARSLKPGFTTLWSPGAGSLTGAYLLAAHMLKETPDRFSRSAVLVDGSRWEHVKHPLECGMSIAAYVDPSYWYSAVGALVEVLSKGVPRLVVMKGFWGLCDRNAKILRNYVSQLKSTGSVVLLPYRQPRRAPPDQFRFATHTLDVEAQFGTLVLHHTSPTATYYTTLDNRVSTVA